MCSGVNVVRGCREETHWGRRVRSSTRKHKYLIEATLTGEQKAQGTERIASNKVFFPTDPRGGLSHSVLYVLYVYYVVLEGARIKMQFVTTNSV